MILALRTDKPEAELYLFDSSGNKLDEIVWAAHRQLSETIHKQIEALLERNGANLKSLQSLLFYEGPGSYTGLRIGASVVNALAQGLDLNTSQSGGDDWLQESLNKLRQDPVHTVVPVYGAPALTTKPKK